MYFAIDKFMSEFFVGYFSNQDMLPTGLILVSRNILTFVFHISIHACGLKFCDVFNMGIWSAFFTIAEFIRKKVL